MENKTFQFVLFILLTGVSSFALADPSKAEIKPADEVVQPAKDNAAKEANKKYEPATRFTPTEKLRADDAVTFPVDI